MQLTCFLLWQTGVEINPGIYPIVPSLSYLQETNNTFVTRTLYQLWPPFNQFTLAKNEPYEFVYLLQSVIFANSYFRSPNILRSPPVRLKWICLPYCPGAFKLHCFQFCFVLDSKNVIWVGSKTRDTLDFLSWKILKLSMFCTLTSRDHAKHLPKGIQDFCDGGTSLLFVQFPHRNAWKWEKLN